MSNTEKPINAPEVKGPSLTETLTAIHEDRTTSLEGKILKTLTLQTTISILILDQLARINEGKIIPPAHQVAITGGSSKFKR